MAYEHSRAKLGSGLPVFAVLGERQDDSPERQPEKGKGRRSESKPRDKRRVYACNPHGKDYHIWAPVNYTDVEFTITGSSTHPRLKTKPPSEERCSEIRK
jgi:hypothetical protein